MDELKVAVCPRHQHKLFRWTLLILYFMKYLMVRSLHHDHWDKSGGEAYFTVGMLKGGVSVDNLVENTPTILIDRNKMTQEIEACWEGKVSNFSHRADPKGRNAIYFRYSVDTAISCPPEYMAFTVGWHLVETSLTPRQRFDMPFMDEMLATRDWGEFETQVFWLLKTLGIHNLYKFDKKEQPGRPDGFFKLGHLAVIYDATLQTDFMRTKKEQINNYCGQLKKGDLEYKNGIVGVRESERQVWIISKGKTHVLTKVDDIVVKEISVQALIDLNKKRIENNLDENQLSDELKNF